jgi:hypothetical protein
VQSSCVYSKELPICFSAAQAGAAVNLLHLVNLGEASRSLAYAHGNFEEIQFFAVLDSNSRKLTTAPFRIRIRRLTPDRALT